MSDSDNNFLKVDISKLVDIVKAVDTPVKLSLLISVIATGMLVFSLVRLPPGFLQSGLVAAMALILVISSIFPILVNSKKEKDVDAVNPVVIAEYGAFISAKMDATKNNWELQECRRNVQDLIAILEKYCKIKNIYYGGLGMVERSHFEEPHIALQKNIKALRKSSKFIMIFPGKTTSSILVEAGMALALSKDSVFFVKHQNELPFLLRQSLNASQNDGLPQIRIYQYRNFPDILRIIETNGTNLFN
jgi:hypothetical protein